MLVLAWCLPLFSISIFVRNLLDWEYILYVPCNISLNDTWRSSFVDTRLPNRTIRKICVNFSGYILFPSFLRTLWIIVAQIYIKMNSESIHYNTLWQSFLLSNPLLEMHFENLSIRVRQYTNQWEGRKGPTISIFIRSNLETDTLISHRGPMKCLLILDFWHNRQHFFQFLISCSCYCQTYLI